MRKIAAILITLSVVSFVATLLIHAATYVSSQLGGVAPFAAFHFVAMGIAIVTILLYKVQSRTMSPSALPPQQRGLLLGLFGNFLVNMAVLYLQLDGGTPEVAAGGYHLADHGRIVRALTRAEYEHAITLVLRFFSSGWMAVFAALACYLHWLIGDHDAGDRSLPMPQ